MTLTELLIGLTILAILTGLAAPAAVQLADRLAVEHQAARILAAYQQARTIALTAMAPVRLAVAADRMTIHRLGAGVGPADSVLAWEAAGPARDGVALRTAPGPVLFAPSGITTGAGNGRYELEKGGVRRAVVASRLGRLRIER